MCEASRDYLLNLLRMYAEKGEKYTFAYLKNDLKNDMSGYDKISPFQQCKKILRLDRISCICDLKYYHTYSIICNVNQIRSLGCTITCYFEPTFIYHGTSYNRPDVKPDTGGRQNVDRENPPSSARRQNRETGIPGI